MRGRRTRDTAVTPAAHTESISMHPIISTHSLDDGTLTSDVNPTTLLHNPEASEKSQNKLTKRLSVSFFIFGLINNVLYVIILSAALDLVPPSTPKGIILFCNIAPALTAKVAWPYILKGRIRYAKRLLGCCLLSTLGMIVVASFDSLFMRLVGISFASFSSGLGELTFLQLSTTYAPPSIAGRCVSYFASGTGAAGLFGALVWWEVRSLGVRIGVGMSSVLPLVIPLSYLFLLPKPSAFLASHTIDDPSSPTGMGGSMTYTSLPMAEDEIGEEEGALPRSKKGVVLSANDKWRLVRPLLLRYMLPLFSVYLFEYTINQGIAPTLIYPVPSPDQYPLLSKLINNIRDYYPLWQLIYQATVFLSRSTISIGIPPLPRRLLPLPSIVQAGILLTVAFESGVGFYPAEAEGLSIATVFLLISLEGICGGLAYVNVYYHINQEKPDPASAHDPEKIKQEREFQIGSIGFSDSIGILLASILSVPVEVELCRTQIHRGKTLCMGL
ncbi:hypothetical protein AMATHDRAFT_54557 [Amanita thiersii Skay4041]|uniref:Protein BTN n=1 Tax=Amanita thiersii Skay4041 TaxID=703135 RepID=A0A2A9NVR5_9AGAR|nr:hypothetical protein AMATHDRAFT_54557 [Amanita thiersii Skay4041]